MVFRIVVCFLGILGWIWVVLAGSIESPSKAVHAQLKKMPIQARSLKAKNARRKIELKKAFVAKKPKKEISVLLKDPLVRKEWGLEKTQTIDAWLKYSQGNSNIVVAVIDTGIDVYHPDLKNNIWRNSKEIPGNGIDDDNNGYVDDIYGWNFVQNNNKVYDTHGHGTHIAGIIGAEGGNGIGVSGVAPRVSLMALKYYDPNDDGQNNLENTVRAIEYAVKNGANIINYSAGGLEGNPKEKRAIQMAESQGVLFVAAAGNEKSNVDKTGYYPASYGLSNILSVTASNDSDQVLTSSNWGKNSVHTAAPGMRILSTLPGKSYGLMTGTSQATAFATGAAVLVMDYYDMKSPSAIIERLTMTGEKKNSLQQKTSRSRRLNISRALAMRGQKMNFMDEMIDDKGKNFFSGEDITQQDMPLAKDLSDIGMVGNALRSSNNKKETLSAPSRKKVSVHRVRAKNRNPSSKEEKESKTISVLKRWFLQFGSD